MEIMDTRHVTPDAYSIESIHVGYDWSRSGSRYAQAYLSISLKPEGYFRNRFAEGGESYEVKKHGAEKLKIRADELTEMTNALSEEIKLCHQLLVDHDLMPKLIEARRRMEKGK